MKCESAMKREDIEKAAKEYTNKITGLDFAGEVEVERAFRTGVNWRINSVWHDASKEAKRDQYILIEDIRGKFTVHKFYLEKWKNMVKIYEIRRWAYVKDLKPNMEK